MRQIGDYIGQHNPRAAARVVKEIHSKTARLLSANPFIGRVGEIKGTRELVIPGTPYIVAYRVKDTQMKSCLGLSGHFQPLSSRLCCAAT